MNNTYFNYEYAQSQIKRSRHPFRKLVKNYYLNNILRNTSGPTIDFGCGAGQLLKRLPAGSIGLEINPHLVDALKQLGLNVLLYDPDIDQYTFQQLPDCPFKTFVMAHVLEHFSDASLILQKLLRACNHRGIERVIIIVPGRKGFYFDKTHNTFIDRSYFAETGLRICEGYAIKKMYYFPFNIEILGNYLTYHELTVVYDTIA